MSKIKIDYYLKTDEEIIEKNIYGIYHDDIITFKDSDIITNILLKDNILKRENNDYIITIDLKNILCNYYLKEYHKYLTFNMKLNKYYIADNNIHIDYDIIYEEKNRVNILFNLNYEVVKC